MTHEELENWFKTTYWYHNLTNEELVYSYQSKIEALERRITQLENRAPVLIEGNTYQAVIEDITYDGKSWHFNNQIFQNAYIKLKDIAQLYPASLRVGYLKNDRAIQKIEMNTGDKIIFTYQENKLRSIKLVQKEPVIE